MDGDGDCDEVRVKEPASCVVEAWFVEVDKDVEDTKMTDGVAPLTARLLDVLACDEVDVGVLKYVSNFAVLSQARYE